MDVEASVLKRNRSRLFVERKEKVDWSRKCLYMEVDGAKKEAK